VPDITSHFYIFTGPQIPPHLLKKQKEGTPPVEAEVSFSDITVTPKLSPSDNKPPPPAESQGDSEIFAKPQVPAQPRAPLQVRASVQPGSPAQSEAPDKPSDTLTTEENGEPAGGSTNRPGGVFGLVGYGSDDSEEESDDSDSDSIYDVSKVITESFKQREKEQAVAKEREEAERAEREAVRLEEEAREREEAREKEETRLGEEARLKEKAIEREEEGIPLLPLFSYSISLASG